MECCNGAVGKGGTGEGAGRALFQTDMIGDVGEGAFALLLEPGVRHCGFLCRVSEATVMKAVRGMDAWVEVGVVEGERWNVYGGELFTTWRVRLARFAWNHRPIRMRVEISSSWALMEGC